MNTRLNRNVERYIAQLQSQKDSKVPSSWHDFIDTVFIGSGLLSNVGIYELEGGRWGSNGQYMSKEEVKSLVRAFLDPSMIYRDGISIEGKRFVCLSAQATAITGKHQDTTVTISKCRTCIIVAIHQNKANSMSAHSMVVKVATYLCEQDL